MLAAERAIVTVEEVVDELEPRPHAIGAAALGASTRSARCREARIRPTPHGYSTRDNGFYAAWDEIARDRDGFLAWMEENVVNASEGVTA